MSFKYQAALAGEAQLIEQLPADEKVRLQVGPQLGASEKQQIDVCLTQQCFSPALSPSFPLSLNK